MKEVPPCHLSHQLHTTLHAHLAELQVAYTVTRFGHTEVDYVSKGKSLGILSIDNPIRNFCIKYMVINPWFDYFITTTILTNCVFLGLSQPPPAAEYVFTAIFTMEMIGRVIGLGFIWKENTYLRVSYRNINTLNFERALHGWSPLSPPTSALSSQLRASWLTLTSVIPMTSSIKQDNWNKMDFIVVLMGE